ncbi:hypothetical protein CJE50_25025 [Salmonella enterica]|nr:hypothetical protein [Salmonella enterica]
MYLKIRYRPGYMSNTSSNFEITRILPGQEFRNCKTLQTKIAIIQFTFDSLVSPILKVAAPSCVISLLRW